MALYAAAAAVLAGVENRQGSIKALVYGSSFQVATLGAGEVGAPSGAGAGAGTGRLGAARHPFASPARPAARRT